MLFCELPKLEYVKGVGQQSVPIYISISGFVMDYLKI